MFCYEHRYCSHLLTQRRNWTIIQPVQTFGSRLDIVVTDPVRDGDCNCLYPSNCHPDHERPRHAVNFADCPGSFEMIRAVDDVEAT